MKPAIGSNRAGQARLWTRVVLGVALLQPPGARAEDTPLSLADLEGYRQALQTGADPAGPLVRFRDLWDRPEAYLGRPVRIEGRIARVFRQAQMGEFPPLAEAWIVSRAGDPFCAVFPITEGRPIPGVGASVRFRGTFLKRLRYQGGDVARVAPLVVGPEFPSIAAPSGTSLDSSSWSTSDWLMGLGAAALVAFMLARRHFARPPSMPDPLDPPPLFVDGDPDPCPENGVKTEGATDEAYR